MSKNEHISKSLKDVWEIKQKAYDEVKNLSVDEAIRKRISDSKKTAMDLGFFIYQSKKTPSQK